MNLKLHFGKLLLKIHQSILDLITLEQMVILVFIHLGSRRLEIVNITQNPTQKWTMQQASNFFYDIDSVKEKSNMKYLIHDKGPQFKEALRKSHSINTS